MCRREAAVQNMETCNKKKIINVILCAIFIFIFNNFSYSEESFKNLENKKVSYLDFFLLKYENKLIRRSQYLKAQLLATRVQYSSIIIVVDFDNKREKIITEIYAFMDKIRYTKKKYNPKLSDCNQVRNLIFYRKNGYKFFTQKRDPALSVEIMEDIFKEVFFSNVSFEEKEIEFLLANMLLEITVYHPVTKKELICSGKINAYELN